MAFDRFAKICSG